MNKTPHCFLMISVVFCFALGACNLPWESDVSEDAPEIVETESAQTTGPAQERPTRPPKSNISVGSTQPDMPQMIPDAFDKAQFISDVTVPDGSTFSAGESFTKTWKLKNVGSCTWSTGYVLAFESGDRMGASNVKPLTSAVAPGEGVNISIDLTAPGSVGSHRGYWQLRNADGEVIPVEGGYKGRSFYVDIRVVQSQGTGQQAPFAVTGVTFTVSHTGFCGRGITYEIQADVTTNGAGKLDYQWIHSDTGDHELPKLLLFNSAGTQTVTTEYKPGASPPFSGMWMDLYINDPNNQQFGRAYLDCP